MKLIKRIYYPIMAVLTILVLVLGFVTSGTAHAPKNEFGDTAAQAGTEFAENFSQETDRNGLSVDGVTAARRMLARSYAELASQPTAGVLESKFNVVEVTQDDDGLDVTETADAAGYTVPVVAVQRSTPDSDTVRKISTNDNRIVYIAKTVQNVVAYIPGTDTLSGQADADVLLISVRFDAIGQEATNAGVLGAAMSHANRLAAAAPTHSNDILFVFADGGIEHSIGLYTFLHQFKGFGGVAERVSVAVDFDTRGNDGALVMNDTTDNASKLLAEYAGINGYVQSNSFVNAIAADASDAAKAAQSAGAAALSFSNIGNLRDERTASDNMNNYSETVVRAHAEMMSRILTAFGSADLAGIKDGNEPTVYFDYAGVFMVVYPALVAMLIAGIIVGLIVAIVVANIKKKTFSFTKALLGALIQLLAVGGAALALYLVYFFLSLLLAGFGVIAIGAAASFSYASAGIIVSALIIFGAFMTGFYVLLKKSFLVKAPDVVRGNVLLTALVAMILSFAAPAVSYMFAIFAVFELAAILSVTLAKDLFKRRHKFDIERLFLPVWPAILCMPLFVAAINLSMMVTSIVMLPILALMFSMLLGTILPFADYLKPVLDKGMKKLPARSIRYERLVTEQVEDRAKKGKFTTVTSKKIIKEQVAWNYRNSLGIATASFFAAVSLLLCASVGVGGYDARIVSNRRTADTYFYDGALSYVYTTNQGVTSETFEVRDRQAYAYISEAVDDLKWNGEKQAYEKTAVLTSVDFSSSAPALPIKSGNEIIYRTASARGRVVLTVTGAKSTDTFTFNSAQNQDGFASENEYVYRNTAASKLTFILPYGWNSFIQIKYSGGSGLEFTFEEQTEEASRITADTSVDVRNLLQHFAQDSDVRPVVNVIFRTIVTV